MSCGSMIDEARVILPRSCRGGSHSLKALVPVAPFGRSRRELHQQLAKYLDKGRLETVLSHRANCCTSAWAVTELQVLSAEQRELAARAAHPVAWSEQPRLGNLGTRPVGEPSTSDAHLRSGTGAGASVRVTAPAGASGANSRSDPLMLDDATGTDFPLP